SGSAAMYMLTSTTSSLLMSVLVALLSLGQVLDPAQATPPVIFDHRAQRAQRGLVGTVEAAGPLPAPDHEPGRLQRAQVLAAGRAGHVELRRDLPRGQFPVPDQLEDPQPARRGDDLERFHGGLLPRWSRRQPILTPGTYFR